MISKSQFLPFALKYLQKGLSVIPVRDKRPLISWKTFQERLPTEEEITSWSREWPDADIAIVCGKVSGGLVVFDVDDLELARKILQTDLKTETTLVKTPRNGLHVYLREISAESKSSPLIPGVADLKANGGYIVVPPSTGYEFLSDLDYLKTPNARELSLDILRLSGLTVEYQKENSKAYNVLANQVVKDGQRNSVLVSLSGLLHRAGLEHDTIVAVLETVNERCCKPPLPSSGVAKIAKSVARYSTATPSPSSPYIYDGKTEMESFEVIPLFQLLRSEDIQITWQIQNFLAQESVGLLAGPPGIGKSWLLMDLAIEFSRAGLWLGRFQADGGRVLYIDEESAKPLLKHRMQRLLKAKGLSEDGLDIHLAVGQGLCLTNSASASKLQEQLETLNPKLVIVDSLIRVHGAEENSAKEMSAVFGTVKRLVRQHQCSFLFADHQRKASHFGYGLDHVRGSSEKVAFVDSLLMMQQSSQKGVLYVDHAKSRYAQPIPSFAVRLQDVGEHATSVTFMGQAEQLKQAERLERATDFIRKLQLNDWTARQMIVEQAAKADLSEKAVDEALKMLTAQGVAQREDRKAKDGRSGKSAFYRLCSVEMISSPSPDAEMETETESKGLLELPIF